MLDLGVQAEPEINDRRLGATSPAAALPREVIQLPEAMIKVQDEITIEVLEDSQARQLVAEMMILAGEVAGQYGQAHSALPRSAAARPLGEGYSYRQDPSEPVRSVAV